jgi:hypothetical protein
VSARLVNKVTGETVVEDAEGREYHLVFDLAAVMQLEASMGGRSAFDLITSGQSISATDCLRMITCGAAGYRRRHPSAANVNPNLAMRIFESAGGLVALAAPLIDCLSRAQALGLNEDTEAETEDEEGEDDNPAPLRSLG